MKRRRFFAGIAGLLGVAKAQQWKECVPQVMASGSEAGTAASATFILCSDETKPAKNGQCPVCGTMARPFKAETELHPVVAVGLREQIIAVRTLGIATRCSRCNAAFFQDGEQ